MDNKELQLIKHYHSRIENYLYNEKDVFSFLILVRNLAKKESAIREFGDFIAHRDKDRGYI